ncbi:hypothetical protein [Butyricicoccus sp.]|uniref:hypothetical protein n=1 Tax=Butyricicoccus sp. TaxID=2049021 RepID=UPI003735306F
MRQRKQVHLCHNIQPAYPSKNRMMHFGNILRGTQISKENRFGRNRRAIQLLHVLYIIIFCFQIIKNDLFQIFFVCNLVGFIQCFDSHAGTQADNLTADPLQYIPLCFFCREHPPADPFADIADIILQRFGQCYILDLSQIHQLFQYLTKTIFFFFYHGPHPWYSIKISRYSPDRFINMRSKNCFVLVTAADIFFNLSFTACFANP